MIDGKKEKDTEKRNLFSAGKQRQYLIFSIKKHATPYCMIGNWILIIIFEKMHIIEHLAKVSIINIYHRQWNNSS